MTGFVSLPPPPLHIDSTMLVAFRQCPRKFMWEYLHCLRPFGRSIDLVAGGAFAAGLEAAYLEWFTGDQSKCLMSAYRAFAREWGDFPDDPKSAKTFTRTFQAVIDYFETYPIETDPIQPMLRHDGKPAFEFSFSLPLGEPFPLHPSGEPYVYCGRFDAFGIYEDTFMVIRDEKTSGRAPTQHWSQLWDLRNQFILYVWAARQFGYDVKGVVVRGITIQKTQFHHIETVPYKNYPQHIIDRAVDQLARDLARLNECYRSQHFDYDFGDACTAFGRPCAFNDLCIAAEPSAWFNQYDRKMWNPLTRTVDPLEPERKTP